MEHLYREKFPSGTEATSSDSSKPPGASAASTEAPKSHIQLTKPCRYGNNCSRPDCKFSHPENDNSASEAIKEDIGAKCAAQGLSWVPTQMTLNLHQSGKLSTQETPLEEDGVEDEIISTRGYELYGICWAILDPATGKAVNIVATINVGPTYHARIASPVSRYKLKARKYKNDSMDAKRASFEIAALSTRVIRWAKKRGNFKIRRFYIILG